MKKILLFTLLMALSLQINAQKNESLYDKNLADSLGGDDYGMKFYVLAILKTGPSKIEDKVILDSLFRGHMANINRLAEDGKLIVAGPLKKNDKFYRGIFILDVKTIEEAKVLLDTDPTIKEKVFEVELFEWYGSAALPVYLKTHKKIEKTKP